MIAKFDSDMLPVAGVAIVVWSFLEIFNGVGVAVQPLVTTYWGEEKALLGLKKPRQRNEGGVERNVRAAIKYLVRKGFSKSGKPVRLVDEQKFWDWATALERYNSRTARTASGKKYCVEYADRIIQRAEEHDRHVGIEIKLGKTSIRARSSAR